MSNVRRQEGCRHQANLVTFETLPVLKASRLDLLLTCASPMAYFQLMLHGVGLSIPPDGATPGIIGFYTTRLVRAATVPDAEEVARHLVLSEWSPGARYGIHGSAGLQVFVESVATSSFLKSLCFANRGYTFYSSNGALDA